MTEKEKSALGLLYDANYDEELLRERAITKEIIFELNSLPPCAAEKKRAIFKRLLGKTGERFTIETPFYCDYGYNIEIGENFFANINLTILDGAKVIIGNDVFIAPNVSLVTAGHPLDVARRNAGLEYAYPISIGDNVWIGALVCVLPGVSVGEGSVIGAMSVVNRSIPKNVLAAGNPCRVIRPITKEDEDRYKTPEFKAGL